MPATVGSISIDLSTNAAKFASGFKQSAATVEQQSARMAKSVAAVETGVNRIGGTLKTFLGGLAAGAGLAALTSLGGAFDKLKETISQFDEIATNSRVVGLRTDTYQALAFSAKQANIDQEAFNSSLSIFAKNAGLAEHGAGALFTGLKNLNPQLLQNILNTKDQEERLKLVSDALAQTTDATQKAALSAIVFGKGGVQMAQFLDQGRASIDAMKKSAQEMGIIVPDELLQRAGALDDKLDVLSKVIDVQLSQALINLAPILTGATQGFADFSKEINSASADIDNFINNPSLQNFGKLFGPGLIQDGLNKLTEASHRSTDAIQADIAEVQKRLDDLKVEAAAGFEVGLATDRAQDELKALQDELRRTSIAAQAAANNQAGSLQGLLDSMSGAASAPARQLPNVFRYGGDPNKITLPNQRYSEQTNANGTGVTVTKFKSSGPWENYNGATANEWAQLSAADKQAIYEGKTDYAHILYPDYYKNGGGGSGGSQSVDDTADNTKDTADNVSKLDSNTHGYFRDLGNSIDSGLGTVSHTVSNLGDLIGNEFGQLPSYLIAALSANGSAIRTGQGEEHLFGPNHDSQHGSYTMILDGGKLGSLSLASTASDGSSNNHATVSQPGSNYTLNYTAAPGDSVETTKQKARAAFNALVSAAESA